MNSLADRRTDTCARYDRDATDRTRLPTSNNRRQSFPRRRPSAVKFLAAVFCLAIATSNSIALAQPTKPAVEIPPEVASYASALDSLQKSGGKQPIEPVFEAGMQAGPSIQAILPELSDSQFQQVQHQMQGFVIARYATTFVRPSVGYFKNLSRKIGTKADRAFFDIYERTEPDTNGAFPAYIRQQTDESGCTRFDGKMLTDLYRGWLTFRTTYPDDYAPEAQGEIDSIETELLSGICSCENAQKTAAGLQTFVTAFPDLPITPKIKTRITQIHANKSSFRFNCHAG
jgi:hypothetical protein